MRSIDCDGATLRYVDSGSGEPIVFLHNGALSHRLWDYQLAHFERSHRVVAPDFLGHGASDRPRRIYTADDFVRQVELLTDHLDLGTFDLVGCCLGGGVALEFARRHADRVRTLSLVTVATPKTIASGVFGRFEHITWAGSPTREAFWRACENPAGRWVMSRAFMRVQCGPRALADAAFREHVLRMYFSDGEWRVFCNVDYSSFAELDQFRKPPGFPPTLVMWGNDNRALRASAGREVTAAIEPERSEFWDGCGYMIMRERPRETNRVLEEFVGQEGRGAASPGTAKARSLERAS
jgi:pimeloyl-ACP methyl ester carboxylesterase